MEQLYGYDNDDVFKVETLCGPHKCFNRWDWKDFDLEKPDDCEYVLLYYKNKPIIAYHRDGWWFDYLEHRIIWLLNVKWWCRIKIPNAYQGYE